MAPETGTALLILMAFVLPGFVTLRINELTHTIRRQESPFERLLLALYYSALTYGVVFLAAAIGGVQRKDVEDLVKTEQDIWKLLVLAVAVLVVIPFVISNAARLWQGSEVRPKVLGRARISLAHSTPSGWDHYFATSSFAYLRVTLRDGRVVGGYYGPESFAGYSDQKQDLYLEHRWELDDDDWFTRQAEGTRGVWLARESIVSVEFYEARGSGVPEDE